MRRASSSGNMATLLGGGGGEHDSAHASDDARASYVSALQLRLEMQTKQNNLLRSRLAAQEVLGERETDRQTEVDWRLKKRSARVFLCVMCVLFVCCARIRDKQTMDVYCCSHTCACLEPQGFDMCVFPRVLLQAHGIRYRTVSGTQI